METFDARHIQALHMLIAGESHKATAKAVGVCDRTIRRWINEADFSAALNSESEAVFSVARVHSRVRFGLEAERGLVATRFVSQVMESDGMPVGVRLRAAEQLRNSSAKWGFWAFKQDCEAAATPASKMESSGGQKPKPVVPTYLEDIEPAKPEAEKTLVDSLLSSLPPQIVPELGKMADISGQMRTRQSSTISAAEHQARRERIARMEKEIEDIGTAAEKAISKEERQKAAAA